MNNPIDILKVIFLGIIEGLTEFIPVSSTAHLLISSHLINFEAVQNFVLEIAIQLGAIIAICIIYRKKIFLTIIEINQAKSQKFVLNLLIAFLPAVIIGFIFHDVIKNYFFNNFTIAISLIIGGIIMIIVDRNDRKYQIENVDQMTYKKSLIIGFCQCLAMIPGVSRSGSTIISAMLCKVNRNTACEFSFFLAIPTILSACCYDVIKNFSNLNFAELELILIGTFSSFISAILVINWFIKYVSKHNFFGFGVYRIIIGIMIMIFLT